MTIGEIPSHGNHTFADFTSGRGNLTGYILTLDKMAQWGSTSRGWSVLAGNEVNPAGQNLGNDTPHNNLVPYLAIHIWKRLS